MNKDTIDFLIEKTPKLKASRHQLERMQPNTYCIHRSWGFGKIKTYNETTNKLIIDFQEGKESHSMDPEFCVDKLEILDSKHILVRQQNEPDSIADLIKNQPVEIIIEILSTFADGSASISELELTLKRLMGDAKFKKWWTNTKKLLIKDPRVAVPVKKNDPYILRDEPLTPEQEILEEFYSNPKPLKKIELAEKLYQLSGSVSEIAQDLPQILEELTTALKSASQLSQSEKLHGVWIRNDLARFLCEDVDKLEPTSTSIIKANADVLSSLAEDIPSSYYPRFLDLLSRVYPESWENVILNLLKNSAGKFTSECIHFLIEKECSDLIESSLVKWLDEQSLKGPLLYWIVRNRTTRRFQRFTKSLIGHGLFRLILYAIEAEAIQLASNKRVLLADILSEDTALIPDLLHDANSEIARDLARRLLDNQGFEPLTKRSLIARFIKQYPEVQSLVSTDKTHSEQDSFIVSKESLNIRKLEYDTLITQKIPENKQAIATAREHGDLRENAEYKMARQDQDMLLARKNILEKEMSRAKISDFTDVSNDIIGVGSYVRLSQQGSNKKHSYAILGAWDSNPEKDVISYKTPLGQSLLGKKVKDSVSIEVNGNETIWTVESIQRWIDVQPQI